MADDSAGELVMRGVTTQGRVFRPSDWADRLAGIFGQMGRDHRMHYSTEVQPVTRAGVRCVVIQRKLADREPRMFQFLLDFARENDLELVAGRQTAR